MEQKRIAFWIDLIFCLVFLPLLITLIPVDRWIVKYTSFAIILIIYLYMLYFIYRKIKLPLMFIQGKYLQAVIVFILISVSAFMLSHFPFPEDSAGTQGELIRYQRLRAQTVSLLFLVVSGFSICVELVFELFRQVLAKKDIEAEKNKAELSLYKAQIDPHFLFNTLNALYGMIVSKSDKTEQAFVKFTEILQYMHAQASSETIPIEDEITYIENYIDLQSFRYNHHTKVVFDHEVDDGSVHIPPMILITFIENAFKYGTSPSRDCEILIRIVLKDGTLHFSTKNNVMKSSKEERTGTGIGNCRRRLDLLYPERYSLRIIRDTDNCFTVSLDIRLLK